MSTASQLPARFRVIPYWSNVAVQILDAFPDEYLQRFYGLLNSKPFTPKFFPVFFKVKAVLILYMLTTFRGLQNLGSFDSLRIRKSVHTLAGCLLRQNIEKDAFLWHSYTGAVVTWPFCNFRIMAVAPAVKKLLNILTSD